VCSAIVRVLKRGIIHCHRPPLQRARARRVWCRAVWRKRRANCREGERRACKVSREGRQGGLPAVRARALRRASPAARTPSRARHHAPCCAKRWCRSQTAWPPPGPRQSAWRASRRRQRSAAKRRGSGWQGARKGQRKRGAAGGGRTGQPRWAGREDGGEGGEGEGGGGRRRAQPAAALSGRAPRTAVDKAGRPTAGKAFDAQSCPTSQTQETTRPWAQESGGRRPGGGAWRAWAPLYSTQIKKRFCFLLVVERVCVCLASPASHHAPPRLRPAPCSAAAQRLF
jgi:hypothetical protein